VSQDHQESELDVSQDHQESELDVSQDHQEQYTKKHIFFQILPIQNII